MELTYILGFFSAILIGGVIGFLGGGGAILAVPVFVYLMKIETLHATSYSLFLVGLTSGIAAIQYYKEGHVNFKAIFPFVIPSVLFLYLTRRYLLPLIPDPIIFSNLWMIDRKSAMMLFFACIMLVVSISMFRRIRNEKQSVVHVNKHVLPWMISVWGTVVGLVAGIVGAGGGFMIVPVMILFLNLPVKMAVGTSLCIICIQSLTGFAGDLSTSLNIDWDFLLGFTGIAVLGMFGGSYLSKISRPDKIRRLFAWFIFCMGITIFLVEIL